MIREALSFVSPADRETWVRMGMAIRSELGDAGFDIWDAWSQQDESYRPASARAVWRSFKGRGITIGTLYAEARRNGWRGEGRAERVDHAAVRARRRQEAADERRRRMEAQRKALTMIRQATMQSHPYLARKGFPKEEALVLNGLLVIAMRDVDTYQLNSVQTIDESGAKKFLAGGKAKGSVFVLGNRGESYLCEGYATALSVRAALQSLYRQARVVVCFSAANLAFVAKRVRGFVVADHDASGTGEKYAMQTGLPWWMPPDVGQDANDYMLAHGVRALASELNGLRRVRQGHGSVAAQYVSSDAGLSVRSCTVRESRESV